jgi:hypothetical protein
MPVTHCASHTPPDTFTPDILFGAGFSGKKAVEKAILKAGKQFGREVLLVQQKMGK